MSEGAKRFLDAIEAGKTHDAQEIFDQEVATRLDDALDSRKVEVASTMFDKADSDTESDTAEAE